MKNLAGQHKKELAKKHYIRKADPNADYWIDFSSNKLQEYLKKYEEQFKLIIWGAPNLEGDFFAIPFSAVKHIFIPKYFAVDARQRWIGRIKYNQLRINNCPYPFDLVDYYGDPKLLDLQIVTVVKEESEIYDVSGQKLKSDSRQNDYAIENRKIEIEARQKQSFFRREVLNNFDRKCCISGIKEENLLVASHIIPWAKRVDTRLDPSNGLCLSILYDKLFDKGYISFDDQFKVIVTSLQDSLSSTLKKILDEIKDVEMRPTLNYPINKKFLKYHRQEIFEKH